MKAIRLLFYGSLLVCLLLGLLTGQRVFHLLFLSGFLLFVAVLGLNLYTFATFKYTQELTHTVCETTDQPQLHLTLFNENRFPLSVLVIRVALASARKPLALTFSLEPHASKAFQISVDVPFCGRFPVGMTTLVVTDVFGLLPMAFSMHHLAYYKMKELVVLPTAYPLEGLSQDRESRSSSGQAAQRLIDQGDGYAQLRDYRAGDPSKRIHWKKSAQHQALLVKQEDLPERETANIWLDTAHLTGSKEERLAQRHTLCEAVATFVRHMLERHRLVRIRLIGTAQADLHYETVADVDHFRLHLATQAFEADSGALLQDLVARDRLHTLTLFTAQNMDQLTPLLDGDDLLQLVLVGQDPLLSPVQTLIIPTGGDVAAAFTAGDLP